MSDYNIKLDHMSQYFFFHGGTHKIIFFSQGTLTYENKIKTKRQLVAHGDYSNIDNCQTKYTEVDFLQYFRFFIYLFHNF
jgi:hypothetical protein